MGCRQSTELVQPAIKFSFTRSDLTRFLPAVLYQGEPYNVKVARPTHYIPQTDPIPHKEKSGNTKTPVQSTGKFPPHAKYNILEPYLQRQRDTQKDRTIVFVLGGPGCGKGTQCDRIVQDFGFVHLSTGDLMRAEVKKGTLLGQNCETLMKEGKLVPVKITVTLIENAMNESNTTRFLIDGFPRAIEQAKAFEEKVGIPDKVLFLECPKQVMEERLVKRAKTSGRVDDTPTTILKRFETFEKESLPVAAYYESVNPKIILKISSVPPPDLVYNEIRDSLKKLQSLKVAI